MLNLKLTALFRPQVDGFSISCRNPKNPFLKINYFEDYWIVLRNILFNKCYREIITDIDNDSIYLVLSP